MAKSSSLNLNELHAFGLATRQDESWLFYFSSIYERRKTGGSCILSVLTNYLAVRCVVLRLSLSDRRHLWFSSIGNWRHRTSVIGGTGARQGCLGHGCLQHAHINTMEPRCGRLHNEAAHLLSTLTQGKTPTQDANSTVTTTPADAIGVFIRPTASKMKTSHHPDGHFNWTYITC